MDIRTLTDEEKTRYIERVKEVFNDIRNTLSTLEKDMMAEDVMIQTSAVWISGQMANWYSDFVIEINKIDQRHQNAIQEQMMSDKLIENAVSGEVAH